MSPFGGGTRAALIIAIDIPRSLEKRLEALARRSGRSIDELAHQAILRYVENSEDADHAERIFRRVRSGHEKTYTLEFVAKRPGIED